MAASAMYLRGIYRVETEVGGVTRMTIVAGFGNETIVGRDVLNRLVLRLNGPGQLLTLGSSPVG